MSKKQSKNGVEKSFFETSTGAKIELIGVSPMLIQKTQTAGVLPSAPYREMAVAFGDKTQKEELTEDDLQNDEEKQQWKEYVEARDKVLEQRQANFFRAILSKGTKLDEAEIERWKKEQVEDWGWDLPANPLDIKVEYVQNELIRTPSELVEIVLAVMEKSEIPEEAMVEARAMFRSSLRQGEDAPSETVS